MKVGQGCDALVIGSSSFYNVLFFIFKLLTKVSDTTKNSWRAEE